MTSSTSDISIGSLTPLSYVRTGLVVRVLIEDFQTQIQAMGIEFDRVKGLSDWGACLSASADAGFNRGSVGICHRPAYWSQGVIGI
jgi:hypothetical protein